MREQPWLSISALAAAIAGIGLGIAALILVLDEEEPKGTQPGFGPAAFAGPGRDIGRELPRVIERALGGAGVGSAWLGVVAEDGEGGVAVSAVAPGSPAEQAGIQEGDVIRSIDGVAVADSAALGQAIAAHESGEGVTIGVEREGGSETVEATLGARPRSVAGRGGSLGPLDGIAQVLPPGLDLDGLPTRIISGEFTVETAEGETKSYRIASGNVEGVTEDRLTIAPEEGEAVTFSLSEETVVLPRRSELTEGAEVLVVSEEGSAEYVLVMEG